MQCKTILIVAEKKDQHMYAQLFKGKMACTILQVETVDDSILKILSTDFDAIVFGSLSNAPYGSLGYRILDIIKAKNTSTRIFVFMDEPKQLIHAQVFDKALLQQNFKFNEHFDLVSVKIPKFQNI